MTTVTAQADKSCGKGHGKECLKRKVLRRPRKTDIEGADVTCGRRLFQVRTATRKAQSPTVDSRVQTYVTVKVGNQLFRGITEILSHFM